MRLPVVPLVGVPVPVDLIQDSLHRRGRDSVDDIDQRVRLPGPDQFDDPLAQLIKLGHAVFEQRVDSYLTEELGSVVVLSVAAGWRPVMGVGCSVTLGVPAAVGRSFFWSREVVVVDCAVWTAKLAGGK